MALLTATRQAARFASALGDKLVSICGGCGAIPLCRSSRSHSDSPSYTCAIRESAGNDKAPGIPSQRHLTLVSDGVCVNRRQSRHLFDDRSSPSRDFFTAFVFSVSIRAATLRTL